MSKSISVVLSAVTGPYQAAMAKAATTTRGFSSAAKGAATNVGGVAQSTGMLNPKLLGAGGVVFGMKKAVDAAIGWESALAGVAKTVDASDAEIATLGKSLQQLSTEMPTTANELAGVAEAAGQLGIQTSNIVAFTETMAMLGETTNLSAQDAATTLARLANIMGTSQTDFDRLGSTIVGLGNNFATTEAEITDMALRLAGAGRQVGLTEGEVLAFATALSSVGINAEAGGSAVSRVFLEMQTAAMQGGRAVEGFAEVAGTSAAGFAEMFREDAAGALLMFIEGLDRISQAGGDTAATLEDLGLGELRVRDALLRTSGASDVLADSLGQQNDLWRDALALQAEFDKRNATTEAGVARAGNSITRALSDIGGFLKPSVDAAGSFVGGAADLVSDTINPSFDDEGNFISGAERRRLDEEAAAKAARGHAATSDRLTGLAEHFAAIDAASDGAAEGIGLVATSQQDLAAFVEDANGDLQHQIDLFRESTADPVQNLVAALEDVETAQGNYNEAVDEFGAGSSEAEDAAWALFDANLSAAQAADTARGKYGDVEESLYGMRDAGLITADQLDAILEKLNDTRGAAEAFEGTYMMILDADIDPALRRLNQLRQAGFHVALPGVAGAGGITQHTGGLISGSAGKMSGLAPDERVRILQVGERVVSAQSAGAYGDTGRDAATTIGSQVVNSEGAIQLVVRDEREGMRAANRELRMMQMGYV